MDPLTPVKALRRMLRRDRTWVPAGHFYSPIPEADEIRRNEARIFDRSSGEIEGVALNAAGQLENVRAIGLFAGELPFPERSDDPNRYGFENEFFSYGDAIFLYGMMRQHRPKRIIEIGSGHSSLVIAETNERFFSGALEHTCVDPFPPTSTLARVPTLVRQNVQELSPEFFAGLEANDILFVDSTHVAKTGSDVNFLIFHVLPRLKPGVLIHFHDIFYPFEYPEAWVYQGRAWNEGYLLRAFLQYNSQFRIELFNSYLYYFHHAELQRHVPLALRAVGAGLWLRRNKVTG